VKVLTTLEGGAVVAPSPGDQAPLEELRMIGVDTDTAARYSRGRNWEHDVVRQGFRYHLGSIPAAMGLAQLEMLDTLIANRRAYCRTYNEGLADVAGIEVPRTDFDAVSPYIYYVRVLDPESRPALIDHLKAHGVATGIHYAGAHNFTYYKDCRRGPLPVTELVSRQQLTLPLHPFMDDGTIDQVVEAVRSFF
jgi:dTDP-4-amino-4,6-dideoxygalactose transaminase